ncbi:MAG: sensor histidine kinase [Thalassotalea sp.]
MEEPRVYIDFKVKDSAIELTFKDNGCGIPVDIIDKIFEPFYTTKRGDGKSGLGLSIIYNIVTQRLGGQVSCQSQEGKGTVFTLKLPVS